MITNREVYFFMKRFVIVGVGGRAMMYVDHLVGKKCKDAELVAVCDNNRGRLNKVEKYISAKATKKCSVKLYGAQDFDKMIAQEKPDGVIVTTPDYYHHEYICRSMRSGCDVVTEKPMTTDAGKCQEVIDAANETGQSLVVTFNYRYSPPRSQLKEVLMSGVIGKVLSVEFKWLLDTSHGADYFRRWHRQKANSGGLMVHKATHHFDLVNWWISSIPVEVSAFGSRVFYNSAQARRYGLQDHGQRCLECPVSQKCNFFLDMKGNDALKELYLDQESYDDYFRDKCVFGDDISIEDTMNVSVRYKSGVFLSYSLNAFSPWEGYLVAFNGTKGRVEHMCQESSYINSDGSVPGELKAEGTWTRVFPHFKAPYNIEIRQGKGGHGGGDIVMLEDIFGKNRPADPLKRAASHVQGAYSILTGIAANKSMAENSIVHCSDLVSGLPEEVGYTEMPGEHEQIPFVKR